MGVTAEQNTMPGQMEDLPGPVNGSHVNGLVKRSQRIKGQGVRKTDAVPHDLHRQRTKELDQRVSPFGQFRRAARKQILEDEIVVPFYSVYPVFADELRPSGRMSEDLADALSVQRQRSNGHVTMEGGLNHVTDCFDFVVGQPLLHSEELVIGVKLRFGHAIGAAKVALIEQGNAQIVQRPAERVLRRRRRLDWRWFWC